MMWMVALFILGVVVLIFLGTMNMKVHSHDEDVWVKVKLRINSNMQAGWCRVIPGRGVKFYDIKGHLIDKDANRVSIIEPFLDSSVQHPIPREKINELLDGYVGDVWTRHRNPFNDQH
jgi:hypothetical protein